MKLRKDLSDMNTQALFVYLVTMSKKNTNNLNNIISVLNSGYYSNVDYTDAINSILDAKEKAIIDINNAANNVISETKELTTEAKVIAQEAKQISTEAKVIAQEAKQISTEAKVISQEAKQISTEAKVISQEAKQISTEAKLIAEEAKQLVDIISNNQNSQYSVLLEKINQVYNLATDASLKATDASLKATDASLKATDASLKATDAKQLATDAKQIVDILSSNQASNYNDLLIRIDFLFNSFYRSTSSNIIQTYGNL